PTTTRPVLVFPGQGAQWVGMATELMHAEPVFAHRMHECAEALSHFVDWNLTDVLQDAEALEHVDIVQPALWAVMVSLADLWRHYGVQPAAVIGHSQGEIAAAVVAGALTLNDGARVVALRSHAIRTLAGAGGMASIPLPRTHVDTLIAPYNGRLSIATVNGPAVTVISGDTQAIQDIVDHTDGAKRINVDYASHSAHVETIENDLRELLAPITPHTGTIPFYS
ncbi:acyltransferase domain-containing protein, partial [Streptomyces boncukensis]